MDRQLPVRVKFTTCPCEGCKKKIKDVLKKFDDRVHVSVDQGMLLAELKVADNTSNRNQLIKAVKKIKKSHSVEFLEEKRASENSQPQQQLNKNMEAGGESSKGSNGGGGKPKKTVTFILPETKGETDESDDDNEDDDDLHLHDDEEEVDDHHLHDDDDDEEEELDDHHLHDDEMPKVSMGRSDNKGKEKIGWKQGRGNGGDMHETAKMGYMGQMWWVGNMGQMGQMTSGYRGPMGSYPVGPAAQGMMEYGYGGCGQNQGQDMNMMPAMWMDEWRRNWNDNHMNNNMPMPSQPEQAMDPYTYFSEENANGCAIM